MGRTRSPEKSNLQADSNEYPSTVHVSSEVDLDAGRRDAPRLKSTDKENKLSKTKQKRLDKFIEKKLKKEERVNLLKSIATSSIESELFHSSKTLGQGKETFKQQLKTAFRCEKAGLQTKDHRVPLLVAVNSVSDKVVPVFASALKKPSPEEPNSSSVENISKQGAQSKAENQWSDQDSISQCPKENTRNDEAVFITGAALTESSTRKRSAVDIAAESESVDFQQEPKKTRDAFYVTVNRPEHIQLARSQLPVVAEEFNIMEKLSENDVIIVCGETGSGKTTQIPQFLYEAGYGNPNSDNPGIIGVTQPRRVAAVTMARRVAMELNVSNQVVSHQVRFDDTCSSATAIKFMTDGILLKEISSDFMLKKYSCIIIDEAHERSINTDILIGLLSRIVILRNKLARAKSEHVHALKIIIMSATLRVQDFSANQRLFPDIQPPIVQVKARQYPVTIHFAKKTSTNYMKDAFKKICQIHEKLPAGGILVFVTGQHEVISLCRKLQERFKSKNTRSSSPLLLNNENDDTKFDLFEESDSENISDFEDVEGAEAGKQNAWISDVSSDLYVLPLYAMLPNQEQMRVFETPPEGSRLCIIATNVAETSVTIPNIRYVVDTGRVKERRFDVTNNVASYNIEWVSQASADQRAGRAGRTGPGHCYRLFSSTVFDNIFEKFSSPEILRTSIERVVLLMKNMHIENVVNFPFPSAPQSEQLIHAEVLLKRLGALNEAKKITNLGSTVAEFPIDPRLARILNTNISKSVLPYAIVLAASLSVGDPFIRETNDDESNEAKKWRQILFKGIRSEVIPLISVYGAYVYEGKTRRVCEKLSLRMNAMKEIDKLRHQLIDTLVSLYPDLDRSFLLTLNPLNADVVRKLQKLLVFGFCDQIAIKSPDGTYQPLVFNRFETSPVILRLHPRCFLSNEAPKFLIYQEIETRNVYPYMKNVTELPDINWLADICPDLCKYSKPLEMPAPQYDPKNDVVICTVIPRFGDYELELAPKSIAFPFNAEYARIFAKELLMGNIMHDLKKFNGHMVCNAALLISKNIPITHSKIIPVVQPLLDKKIMSRANLVDWWKQQPQFLLSGVLNWYSADVHDKIKRSWPPKT